MLLTTVPVLASLMGGKDSLETWLDRLFAAESDLIGRHQVDITGLIWSIRTWERTFSSHGLFVQLYECTRKNSVVRGSNPK